MANNVSDSFEKAFLGIPLHTQIDHCDGYELAALFLRLFKNSQPVLEAGCGSGRWNAWLARQGIRSVGLDWSEGLCGRAATELPDCSFIAGDMQTMPLRAHAFGGLIALGSVEHTSAGPLKALKEFRRVLKAGGVAVVTVPYGGRLRRALLLLFQPLAILKSNRFLRRLLRKRGSQGRSLRNARTETVRSWFPVFACDDGGHFFYEYYFNKTQMRRFLAECGFRILQEFVGFGDEGILHNFGRLAGAWNEQDDTVDFTVLGKLLRRFLPVSVMGHMLCYVITKQ
jgi:ubiquinone/menaquinone biosynthesis C-methylase UbiE